MKYFLEGGDFSEGFYLSARDYDKCEISYGKYDGYRLHLTPGKYTVKFNSIFWNQGSMDGNVNFDFSVTHLDGSPVSRFGLLSSTGNLDENNGQMISGSKLHEYEFSIESEGDYLVTYTMSSGWAAVIVGNLSITTSASAADKYKGGFLRAMASANALYASINGSMLTHPTVINLKSVIDRYENFTSTSPTKYESATGEILAAIAAVDPSISGIECIGSDGALPIDIEYYDLSGHRVSTPSQGVNIMRIRYSGGHYKVIKKVFKNKS